MDIQEVSQILGLCHFLRAPEHVFITSEPVSSDEDGKRTFYRGLQPKGKSDSIFLSAQADKTTPIHETIHTYGLDEAATAILTQAIMRKNAVLKNFPLIRGLTEKKLVYKLVQSSEDYPQAHDPKFSGRVDHYVLCPKC